MARLFERGKGRRLSPWAMRLKFLARNLQRWRAAPAEGVHSDEISDERSSPKFELGPKPPIPAVFLLISHLAAPLFPRFEPSMGAFRRSSLIGRPSNCKSGAGVLSKKERPGWRDAAEAGSSYDCSSDGYLPSGYNEGFRRTPQNEKDWLLTAALVRQIVPLTDETRSQIANAGCSGCVDTTNMRFALAVTRILWF